MLLWHPREAARFLLRMVFLKVYNKMQIIVKKTNHLSVSCQNNCTTFVIWNDFFMYYVRRSRVRVRKTIIICSHSSVVFKHKAKKSSNPGEPNTTMRTLRETYMDLIYMGSIKRQDFLGKLGA